MQTSEVEIQQEPLGPNTVVRVRGTVNIENSPKLRDVLKNLADGKAPGVIVGLEGARAVDTSGLATLVECSQNMQAYGGRLLVAGLNSHLADAYSLASIEGAFAAFDTEGEAAEALKADHPEEAGSHKQ